MKKQRYLGSLLRNAERILNAAGLQDGEFAVAMNRIYRYYSGDDVFKICGIKVETHYSQYTALSIENDPQMTIEELIAKADAKAKAEVTK